MEFYIVCTVISICCLWIVIATKQAIKYKMKLRRLNSYCNNDNCIIMCENGVRTKSKGVNNYTTKCK